MIKRFRISKSFFFLKKFPIVNLHLNGLLLKFLDSVANRKFSLLDVDKPCLCRK